MGYRSEIGLCLDASAQAQLEAGLLKLANEKGAANASTEMDPIQGLFQSAELRKDEDSGSAAYYWPSLKWYDDFPEVRFIESFLQELDEGVYLFIRLGESDDDTEIKGAFWDNPLQMSMIRTITFD